MQKSFIFALSAFFAVQFPGKTCIVTNLLIQV